MQHSVFLTCNFLQKVLAKNKVAQVDFDVPVVNLVIKENKQKEIN